MVALQYRIPYLWPALFDCLSKDVGHIAAETCNCQRDAAHYDKDIDQYVGESVTYLLASIQNLVVVNYGQDAFNHDERATEGEAKDPDYVKRIFDHFFKPQSVYVLARPALLLSIVFIQVRLGSPH